MTHMLKGASINMRRFGRTEALDQLLKLDLATKSFQIRADVSDDRAIRFSRAVSSRRTKGTGPDAVSSR